MPRFSRATRTLIAGTAAGVLALTTGCAAIGDLTSSVFGGKNGIDMASVPAGEPLWKVETQTAAQPPRIAGDTVVAYVVEDGALMIKGFGIDSGKEQWAYPAETGASRQVLPNLALDSDGNPIVGNFSVPERLDLDSNNFYWHHPIQVIDVNTGELRGVAPAEWWLYSTPFDCADATLLCFAGVNEHSGGQSRLVGIDATGTIVLDSFDSLPDLAVPKGAASGNASLIFGEHTDGTPTAWFVEGGKASWSIPLTELGQTEFTQELGGIGYDYTHASVFLDAKEQVLLVDVTQNPKSGVTRSHAATVTALNPATGEKLWSKPADLCAAGTALICEGEVSSTEKESGLVYAPGDYTLSMVNLRTGEAKWSHEEKNFPLYNQKKAWGVAGGSALVLNTEIPKLLDLSSGKVTEITPEQSFGCYGEGKTFEHHRSSRPDLPLVSDTSNVTATACTIDSVETDPAAFSQGVVASISQKPFDADESWNVFAKQIRVIATADGIYAYEF